MIDYTAGKIYKLVNDIDDEIYVGSTCNSLWSRFGNHKTKARFVPDRLLYQKMNLLGFDHFKMILIEDCNVQTKDQLRASEQYHIDLLKPALNVFNAVVDEEELKLKLKAYKAEYAIKNKEAIALAKHERYELNKAEILEKNKKYREENKERIRDAKKEYRIANLEKLKEKASQKVECSVCGSIYGKRKKAGHERTDKHQKALFKET